MKGLDYHLHFIDEEWQVWTPDAHNNCGACIGVGKTRLAALRDAHRHLVGTADKVLDDALKEVKQ